MYYVLLVSHGEFAPGLHSALKMIVGDRENVLSVSLKDGMGADEYAANVRKLAAPLKKSDKIVMLADIIGGSPLTTAVNTLFELGISENVHCFGGMCLPMALAAVLTGENLEGGSLSELILNETKNAVQEFAITADSPEDDI
jgi:PTS system N-acetylgalactosamine-specific IIA component